MAYLPHHRVTFKGEFKTSLLAEPYETWNTSLAFRGGEGLLAADRQSLVNDLAADFKTFLQANASTGMSTSTYFTECRLDAIGTDGKITQDAVLANETVGWGGNGGGVLVPPQCALVLTLDTGVRGRSRFGRMYLPFQALTLGLDGRITEASQQNILTTAATFINNASNAVGIDLGWEACVASNVGSGSLNRVQAVRVGRVVDTMRSRRRSMDEAYKSASVDT